MQSFKSGLIHDLQNGFKRILVEADSKLVTDCPPPPAFAYSNSRYQISCSKQSPYFLCLREFCG
ncbi:hypothetical protein RchiOBHm_Chr6g0284541 [Rosa chinensis]|uniref:Uncharacterized protein n=1 Tax=Rosa chinensis TaxID=74649 RepID=A0A2P6PUA1_ROSCH|nr:hypothetical protein RchiOBHm_Chr6g0284541 [Rosa chinensis]